METSGSSPARRLSRTLVKPRFDGSARHGPVNFDFVLNVSDEQKAAM